MYSQLVIAALATSASAASLVVPGHIAIKYENHNVARATGTATAGLSDAACETEVMSVAAGLPTAAPAFESYALTQTQTDACAVTVPASLSAEYSSYLTALESWYTASGSSAIYSVLSQCPQYAAYTDSLSVCSTDVAAATSASSAAKSTGTASGSSAAAAASGTSTGAASSSSTSSAKASSSSSASKSGASAREVGIVGAVLAGVLGAAAAL